MTKYKVGIISLGCDKNRIDTEIILGSISSKYEITNNPNVADIIIVNTCGFIEKSKQESIDTILEMAEYKEKHNCKILVATGCLTQRYGKELLELMPEIDIILGVNDYNVLLASIDEFISKGEKIVNCNDSNLIINEGTRILTTDKESAYIRIAEGCDNFCTYCIIPKIRGKYRSRKMESILEEARTLSKNGVKEIILVAQDTTRYGIDLYGKKMLASLLKEISLIEGIEWIRVLYCYPEEITEDLIDEIASNSKVCHYLDIPIQHISNNILKKMGRKTTKESILKTIDHLRERIPDITLRTSLIVGFPSETEDDFKELQEFLKEYKLDNVGVFCYSQEEGTPAAIMKEQIDEEVKEIREKELMRIQQGISKDINRNKVGCTLDALIEDENEKYYIGRTKYMAPEIDGLIYIAKDNERLKKGDIVPVSIVESLEYDLIGVVKHEFS